MPARLPLFPLPVVLFPGTPLPLHIFEPRYRQMLADCLETDRRFGITPLNADEKPPTPGTVGCTAEIRVNQELPDGRSAIVVLGGERFVISRILDEETPYYVGMVNPFDDDPATAPDEERTARLREQFTRYAAHVRELSDVPPVDAELPDDPLALSFHAAAGVEVDPEIKQRLLAERSTMRRMDSLLLLLPMLTAAVQRALVVHRRAHGNGRGDAHPSIPPA
ncbi:MAG TPA: LON peptidase substrate-binding domain-containing protein [Gemmatimonadales bacterium]|nr:LON peptidase substrate-binding domain-containing protein [Gemmatimonadales bacterium]